MTLKSNMEIQNPLTRIIENLVLQKDNYNNFLQIADLVAGASEREYNSNLNSFSSRY